MPIYEYKCTACEHEFEAIQKFSDEPLIECPSCRKDALKKKISAAAFRLKGGGWYETDFKSGNKKNLAGDSDKPKESGSKPEGSGATTGSSSGGESSAKPASEPKGSSKPASPA